MTGELLSPAVLAGVETVAGAEQHTKLLEGETLWTKVGEEVAVVVVLTELTAGGDVRDLGEGGEEVVRSDNAGLVPLLVAPLLEADLLSRGAVLLFSLLTDNPGPLVWIRTL